MKRERLRRCKPCELPMKENNEDKVIAVSMLQEVDGEQAVEISLFYMGALKGRYFADKHVHNAWVNGAWSTCRLNNVVRMCKGEEPLKEGYYYIDGGLVWNSNKDKERALGFLDTYSIERYEYGLQRKKSDRAYERKKERIEKQMAEVPCVPEEAVQWVKQSVFPGEILFTKNTEKRVTYACTACGRTGWKKKGWKHGMETDCPKCGARVKVNSRQEERVRKEWVTILQRYGKSWAERQFKAVCTWSGKGKEIELWEEIRAIIPEGKRWGKLYYGVCYEADEFMQEFWDKKTRNQRFWPSFLFPKNLEEVLTAGGLERSGMMEMAEAGRKFNVNNFITTFECRKWMEYLIKAGLYRLTEEILDKYWWGIPSSICERGKNLKEVLKLNGNRVHRLKQVDGGLNTLEWLQYEEKTGCKISQETLEWLANKKVSKGECEDLLEELESVNRMVNYMRKQEVTPRKLTTTWRDYLQMARAEGYDTTDDIVRFPRNLKARHDQLVETRNARRDAERIKKEKGKYRKLDAQIKERMQQVKRYFWEDERYMIIPAGTCEELITEGRTLHHCVGSSDIYMNKMAAGTSWILFLRKKENLEKAYYTVEIDMKDDKVLQYYSEFDRQPDKAVISKVLDKFKQSIKRSRQQARIQVPVADIA